jgi:2-C-methyl-D-erythritol 4-phosphate cytidylyltransferase/2-C-methyl-D-erythritol 2,4-cyclodiphosphate synthase
VTTAAGPPQPGSVDVVVVAAGASRRMAGRDKLAALIGDRPLLAWTLERLAAAAEVRRIVVVTSTERLPEIRRAAWLPASVVDVVAGGARRQESVAAGVERLAREAGGSAPDRVILVHDGARPLISTELVAAVAEATRRHGAAIPVLALAETVKRIAGDDVVETVDRTDLATAQTPQGIRRDLLERAWASFPAAGPRTFTDEAGLLEACRIPVHAVPGDPVNIKVTVPDDLDQAAAALLGQGPADGAGRPAIRVGFGSDEHPFGPGRSLALAGITIAGSPSLHGHSDGDVALHAIADALLGACGLGDLGRLFPAGPETPRGAASGPMLGTVLARVRAAGYAPTSLDLTIVAARPRLAEHLDAMRLAVAELLGLAPERVNVKASSGNLEGWQGGGRGISATAVAVVSAVVSAVVEARP